MESLLAGRYQAVTETGCWLWEGSVGTNGYGAAFLKRKRLAVHRLAYSCWVGPIPEGMMICHKCDTRTCINPNHLYAGTALTNNRDTVARGRRVPIIGAGHKRAKLDEAKVKDIRRNISGLSQKDMASKYGVDKSVINEVVNYKIWKHVE